MILPMIKDEQLEMILIYTSAIYTLGVFTIEHVEKIVREEFKEEYEVKLILKRMEEYLESNFVENTNTLRQNAKFKVLRRHFKNGCWRYSLSLILNESAQICVEKIKVMLINAAASYKITLTGEKTRQIEKKEYLYLSHPKVLKLWVWAEQNGNFFKKR